MAVREVLLLGNPQLSEVSEIVERKELDSMRDVVDDLQDTLVDFRSKYGAGRAIAAPQIGVLKRLVYVCVDFPIVLINPKLDRRSEDMIEVWDDCLCFPDLLVKVRRHRSCRITYKNMDWEKREMLLEGELSELLQHECDHLDGVLAISRAIDSKSFCLRNQKHLLEDTHVQKVSPQE
ncbi:MAG: peptide deformylase [Gemmatimonadota bacterium]|nr:MAG: peptide deformylase [Gemmatimonadota bacterium]